MQELGKNEEIKNVGLTLPPCRAPQVCDLVESIILRFLYLVAIISPDSFLVLTF